MELNEYQKLAAETAIYSREYSVMYPALGLSAETGELNNVIKKVMRDNNGYMDEEFVNKAKSELGDVLWYVAALCKDLGLDLDDVAKSNLEKLAKRKERGTIRGSGDER